MGAPTIDEAGSGTALSLADVSGCGGFDCWLGRDEL